MTGGGLGDEPSEQVALSGGRQSKAAGSSNQVTVTENGPKAHEQSQEIKVCSTLQGKILGIFKRRAVMGTDFYFKTEHTYCRVGFGFLWGQSVLGSPKGRLEDVR